MEKRVAPAGAGHASATAAAGATATAAAAAAEGAAAAGDAAAAPGDAQAPDHPYALEWQGSEALHLFWGVDALPAEEMARAQLAKGQEHWGFNVALVPREYYAMAKIRDFLRVCVVQVPCMQNTRALRRGDRLFLEIKKPTPKHDARQKKEAWQSEREKQEKKRKRDAQPGSGAKTRQRPGAGGDDTVYV